MEIEDAEDNGSVYGRGGVLFGFDGGKRGPKLLKRMGFVQASPTPVYGRERAKHIDIRKHFAHEVIQNGEMLLVRVPTASQLADIFTKGLHYPQWQACVEGILGKTFKPS